MQSGFSQNLIKQAQAYFSRQYSRHISAAETVEFLNSLADLYEVYRGLAAVAPALKRGTSADLIDPHSC